MESEFQVVALCNEMGDSRHEIDWLLQAGILKYMLKCPARGLLVMCAGHFMI